VFEFVLMLPIFFGFILLAVDFGVWMHAQVAIANAAREGARYAALCGVNACVDGTPIKNRVLLRSSGIIDSANDVTVWWRDRDSNSPKSVVQNLNPGKGDSFLVRVIHPHQLLFVPGHPTIVIMACSEMRLEADVATYGQAEGINGSGLENC
jgi:hypothetical protein